MSPSTIICCRTYDYNLLCGPGSQYDECVQTHEKITNTMKVRSVGFLILRLVFLYYDSLVSYKMLFTILILNLDVACITIDVLHYQYHTML